MMSRMHPIKVMLTNLTMKILWIEPIDMVYAMSMKVNTMCAFKFEKGILARKISQSAEKNPVWKKPATPMLFTNSQRHSHSKKS